MRFSTITALAFGVGAIAAPGLRRRDDDDNWCMTDAEANQVAENFKTLISAYTNASAERFLCTSFTDYSDSVIELINNGCYNKVIPLGTPTFTDRTSFEAGQGSQPDSKASASFCWCPQIPPLNKANLTGWQAGLLRCVLVTTAKDAL